ncbi:MAG: LutC/YkgG family protein [Acidimicrobiales bacterium]
MPPEHPLGSSNRWEAGLDARSQVLARARLALRAGAGDGSAPERGSAAVKRDYRGSTGQGGNLDIFADRLVDYGARVRRCAGDGVQAQVTEALAERAATRVVVPAGFPAGWLPVAPAAAPAARLELLTDEPVLSAAALDGCDGVVTTCAAAIAETGTIILDHGPGQGRRALTLVPDYHLVVVQARQVLAGVPDAVALVRTASPVTWISGPSATSDIELNRVQGVHGPRHLAVVLAEG